MLYRAISARKKKHIKYNNTYENIDFKFTIRCACRV